VTTPDGGAALEAHRLMQEALDRLGAGDVVRAKRAAKRAFLLLGDVVAASKQPVPLLRSDEVDWSRWDGLLGVIDDESLAPLIGCSVWAVGRRRCKRGIRHSRWVEWTPSALALLGRVSDTDAAAVLGCTHSSVRQKRLSLGIPLYRAEPPEWRGLVGKVPDAELAREYGVSVHTVRDRRRAAGKKPCPGTGSGLEWIDEDDAILGTMPDSRVAKLVGCSASSVGNRRRELGIPAFSKYDWAPHEHLLGKISDEEMARLVGCTVRGAENRRRKRARGIPMPGRWPKS